MHNERQMTSDFFHARYESDILSQSGKGREDICNWLFQKQFLFIMQLNPLIDFVLYFIYELWFNKEA